MGTSCFQVWVSHYEPCHVLPLCPYHNQFWRNLVELFYHDNNVDGGGVWKFVVFNTRNCFVHNISNYDLEFFHWNVFLGITIFWPMGDIWLLISGLVSIILTESSSKDVFCHVHQYFWKSLMNCSTHCYCCCSSWTP